MQKVIIAETSCLILLEQIGELVLLQKLFGSIIITSIVAEEFGHELPLWIKINNPENITYQKLLETTLDKGESSSIALAVEKKDCLIILDDLKARKIAFELGLTITGTIGVLIDAKQQGYIKSIKVILEKIKSINFRISSELENKILKTLEE